MPATNLSQNLILNCNKTLLKKLKKPNLRGKPNTKNLASVRCAIKIIPLPLKEASSLLIDSVIVHNGEHFHSRENWKRLLMSRVAQSVAHGFILQTSVMLERKNVGMFLMVKSVLCIILDSSMG